MTSAEAGLMGDCSLYRCSPYTFEQNPFENGEGAKKPAVRRGDQEVIFIVSAGENRYLEASGNAEFFPAEFGYN